MFSFNLADNVQKLLQGANTRVFTVFFCYFVEFSTDRQLCRKQFSFKILQKCSALFWQITDKSWSREQIQGFLPFFLLHCSFSFKFFQKCSALIWQITYKSCSREQIQGFLLVFFVTLLLVRQVYSTFWYGRKQFSFKILQKCSALIWQ